MPTFLRNKYVFGTVNSRRLGNSLGVNVLPLQKKVCNFNCIYCECGWNNEMVNADIEQNNEQAIFRHFPAPEAVKTELREALTTIKATAAPLDVITFSGNGEPTLHPQFEQIVGDTIEVRNSIMPSVKIAVLSNATTLHKPNVFTALRKIDKPILKLDSANITTLELINLHKIKNDFQVPNDIHATAKRVDIDKIVAGMKQFEGKFILQIMFLRGEIDGAGVDNTNSVELQGLMEVIRDVRPAQVMIYSLDRQTPASQLIKIEPSELQSIAAKLKASSGCDVMYV